MNAHHFTRVLLQHRKEATGGQRKSEFQSGEFVLLSFRRSPSDGGIGFP
jgi:hypothetical protein